MRIRSKILLACLSLTGVTLILGGVSLRAQTTLSQSAVKLYDEAFMSLSYLRSAQNTFLLLARDLAGDRSQLSDVEDRLGSAGDDLEVVEERAPSPQGRAAAHDLRARALQLAEDYRRGAHLPTRQDLTDIEARFDVAAARSAEDGDNARRADRAAIALVWRWTVVVMGAGVALALAITLLLSRAVVPALRHAVGIATAIADGRLDNRIHAAGSSETSLLLRALATMQSGIADQVAQIEELMAQQVETHASAMASQGERFEAALDNMAQGLCMVDAEGRLLVHNRRFVEMFGPAPAGTPVRAVLPAELLGTGVAEDGSPCRRLTSRLPDDRIVSVTERTMGASGWVATYEDVTEKHLLEARIAHMARHDALTGLPNRAQFLEQIGPRLAQVRRGGSLAVLYVDLESFKTINDEVGHQAGDDLLRAVGRRLLDVTRKADLAARLGGDEFAIIQSSLAQPLEAQALAQRVIACLSEPFNVGGRSLTIGVSIGIALTDDGRTTPEAVLNSADLALQRAKGEGRGGYRFFDAALDAAMQARRLLELDLRRAIAERQFTNYYQPLVEAQTRALCGFEALVRWRHPTRGMVPPNDFIPLAEETGLIAQIGRQVLERACKDATAWPHHIRVAVNLSPLQFRDKNLASDIRAILAQSKLDPTRLELEITESLLLQDDADTLEMLHEVRACGVSIAMDDFGTGYSSLSYLRRFPFDKIKVDGSFVRSLDERREALPIVRAIIALGKSMGMRVIAEGVETERQLALLRSEGCEQVQGYLFSKPMPLEAFSSTLRNELAVPA